MKNSSFKKAIILGSFAVATMILGVTQAHAENMDQENIQAKPAQLTSEDVGNFFKGVWGKTKEVASDVSVKAVAGAKVVGEKVGQGMQSAGAGFQEMSKPTEANNAPVENAKVKKINHKTSKKEKAQELKVEKAQINILGDSREAKELSATMSQLGDNTMKAKDNIIGGISNLLGKLRSNQNQENENSPSKPGMN